MSLWMLLAGDISVCFAFHNLGKTNSVIIVSLDLNASRTQCERRQNAGQFDLCGERNFLLDLCDCLKVNAMSHVSIGKGIGLTRCDLEHGQGRLREMDSFVDENVFPRGSKSAF